MSELISIAAFMKRRIPALRHCDRDTILKWLTWHSTRKSLAFVTNDQGKVIAAGVARPIDNAILELMESDFKFVKDRAHYLVNENSDLVYAEHAASNSPQGLAGILLCMQARFPKATKFIFRKKNRKSKFKTYNMNRFIKVVFNQALIANKLESVG